MRRSRSSEEQIVFVLRQAEAGAPVVELIRKYGISQQAPSGAVRLRGLSLGS